MVSIKIFIIEWICEVVRALFIYLANKKAKIEIDQYVSVNENIDMRTAPPTVKYGIIHDQEVLKARWDICLGCEYLTESNRCQKCGCFMKSAHKIAMKRCPVGKWNRYKENIINGVTVTS